MAENLEWIFALVDRMSGPSLKIADALEKLASSADKTGKKSDEAEKHVKSFGEKISEANEHALSGAVDHFAESLAGVEIAFKAAEAVGELVEKLVDLGVELVGEALKAATFEQHAETIFHALMHTEEGTAQATEGMKAFAQQAGLRIPEVAGHYQRLLLAGAKLKDVPILLQAATDVGNLTGRGPGELLSVFERIKSTGHLSAMEFRELRGALPVEGFDKLAKSLGFAATEGGRFKGATVEGGRATKVLLETIANLQGGKLGETTAKVGAELPGIMNRAKNNFELLLGSISKTEGFKNLLVVAERFVALFDPNSKTGKALVETFSKAATAVGEFLAPLTEPGAAQDTLDGIVESVRDVWHVLQVIGTTVMVPVNAFEKFLEYSDAVLDSFVSIYDLVVKTGEKLLEWGLGKASGAASAIGSALGGVGQVASVLGLPQFAEGGVGQVASMLGLSQFAEGGEVPGSGPQLAVVHGGETVIPAGGGRGMSVNLTQYFTIGGDAHSPSADLARHIAAIGAGELVAALESAAVQAGAF